MARPENSFGNGRPTDKPVAPPYVHQEYPRVMHHPSGGVKFVKSLEEEDLAISDGYSRQPHATASVQTAAPKAGECPACLQLGMENADLKVRFDAMWKKRAEENEARVETLNARIATLESRNEALVEDLAKAKKKPATQAA